MAYKTIHTSYGLMRLAQAEATGVPIKLTHMAVGDGGGNAVTPNPAQSVLVRERYRHTINRVTQDPADPLRFTAELVIPASAGGFTLREVGIFDEDGSLFVVGNLPATYKPVDEEGAFADTVVRVDFLVSNASTITIEIDPNIVVVTQQWITNNVTAGNMFPGGTTGQVLTKNSNTDGDAAWKDPTDALVVVDTIAELQTLAAGQTVVDLTETITYGLAVYIEGIRLPRMAGADGWQPDPAVTTRLTLGKSYPEGTRLQAVNNEPAGSAPAPLERRKNLSDVQSVPTARANLGVMSAADVAALAAEKAPPSAIMAFARGTAPAGWLKANGAAISRTAYAALFAAIGTTYGAGDGFTTFNIPDLRGEFIRGADDGRGLDAGRAFGSVQAHALGSHSHGASASGVGNHNHGGTTGWVGDHQHITPYGENTNVTGGFAYGTYGNNNLLGSHSSDWDNSWPYTSAAGAHNHGIAGDGAHSHTITVDATGIHETRPRNVALLYCIKI